MVSPFPESSSSPGQGSILAKILPNGMSGLEKITYQYPLKLISPAPVAGQASVLVFLLSYGGGLVGGDSVNLSINLCPKARLSLVTQGHTKIFKSTSPDVVTRQTMNVQVSDGAALCLLPDPVQPFEKSVYEQTQVFRVAASGSLCLLDWVTQGRIARGEDWGFVRWTGLNEVWAAEGGNGADSKDRLLLKDAVLLGGDKNRPLGGSLRQTMHGLAVVGTLILSGPAMKGLGEFFLAEFAALPRLGGRDFGATGTEGEVDRGGDGSTRDGWRSERTKMEKQNRVLWSAANVRSCVVIKFGTPSVEGARLWVGSMLAQERTISTLFGDHALMCVR